MRRRASSHNLRRLPVRVRLRAQAQTHAKQLEGKVTPRWCKKESRRKRRYIHNLVSNWNYLIYLDICELSACRECCLSSLRRQTSQNGYLPTYGTPRDSMWWTSMAGRSPTRPLRSVHDTHTTQLLRTVRLLTPLINPFISYEANSSIPLCSTSSCPSQIQS